MDLKIASAFNLSPELVWFSRQSFAEELSSSSSPDSPSMFGPDLSVQYGAYFPETPYDLGSDGIQSPGRDDTDEEVDSSGDDFSHALFAQEQMILEDHDHIDNDPSCQAMDTHLTSSPNIHQCQLSPVRSMISPLASSYPSPSPPSPELEIDYTPSPPSSDQYPELMVASSPVQMESLQVPVATISRPQVYSRRRLSPMAVTAWQREILQEAFTRDSRLPGREQLRQLAQRSHLHVSDVKRWFVEQRRILFHRMKFGFFFTDPVSRTSASRTINISTTEHCRRH